ncbi:hypothetical protein ACOSP7_010650 [Xanthoceras sorbifolium]
MLENIRRMLMRMISRRLKKGRKWGSNLPPKVAAKIAERQDKGRFVSVFCASDHEYECKEGQNYFIVNLRTLSCDYGLWEVSGMPCKHAMAVITGMRLNCKDFVHKYLTTESYLKTYNYAIHPVPNESKWPESMPRKPKKNRKRGPDEPQKKLRNSKNKCGKCGELGHNSKSCKAADAADSRKGKRKVRTLSFNFICISSAKTTNKKRTFENETTSNTAASTAIQPSTSTQQPAGYANSSQNVTTNAHLHHNQGGSQTTQTSVVRGTATQLMTSIAPLHSDQNARNIMNHSSNPDN